MSAIAGIFYLDAKLVDPADMSCMLDALAYRGPDNTSQWIDGPVGLGQCMLWTTPESLKEQLPLWDPMSGLCITADARIDNREELLTALHLLDSVPGGIADSQLILAAYEKWRETCAEKLVGDFAFAVWDSRSQQFFCARDPMGVKPFYYYRSASVFAFGSEIKALLCLEEVPRRLNEERVADHLVPIFDDRASTFYRDIFQLPGAHSMTVTRDSARAKRYWALDPDRELKLVSDQAYAYAFREVFTKAVRCRLRSHYPIGSSLSGGMDSSSVACIARSLLPRDKAELHTFSAVFPDLPDEDLRVIDEREYIDSVLSLGGFDSHLVRGDLLGPLSGVSQVLHHSDEPLLAPNLYIHCGLYQSAQEHGVRVFLDGLDGDSTVSHGYERLSDLVRLGRWKTLYAEATALSARYGGYVSRRRVVWQYGLVPLIPGVMIDAWRILRNRRRDNLLDDSVIQPDFMRRVGVQQRIKDLSTGQSGPTRSARSKHWQVLNSPVLQYALEVTEKATASYSVEARYPFFDRRLMEFCLSLPVGQKLNQGWPRAVLRHAMQGILPEEVQWRVSKANLGRNFLPGLTKFDRDVVENIVYDDSHVVSEYVDLQRVRVAYDRCLVDPRMSEQEALAVYKAIMLAMWLEKSAPSP